jgi:hypothetical protein
MATTGKTIDNWATYIYHTSNTASVDMATYYTKEAQEKIIKDATAAKLAKKEGTVEQLKAERDALKLSLDTTSALLKRAREENKELQGLLAQYSKAMPLQDLRDYIVRKCKVLGVDSTPVTKIQQPADCLNWMSARVWRIEKVEQPDELA